MRNTVFILFMLVATLLGCTEQPAQKPTGARVIPLAAQTVEALLERRLTPNFVPGEVVVKMKPAASGLRALPVTELKRLNLETKREQTSGGEVVYRLPAQTLSALSVGDARARTLAMVKSLRARADVAYAQPNYIFQITTLPNDSGYPKQWHYFDNGSAVDQAPGGINLPTAWKTNQGSAAVVVAVIDTGILPGHEDIDGSPNLISGYDMIADPGMAHDGDARDADPTDPGDGIVADECYAGSPMLPSSWHGTHVAGTVGVGKTNNNLGVAGINWNVKLQPVRVLGKCGGTLVDINDAIRWAAGLPVPGVPANPTPAKVINMRLGGASPCSDSPATQSAINDALAKGVTVVVAAGNESADVAQFMPGSCNGVITVAASDRLGNLATRYSNFGARVDILAPGGDVRQDSDNDGNPDGVLSMIEGGYAFYNGTSMAAPHTAGVAALLLAQDATRSPAQILSLLKANALPRSALQCPKPCGAGLLNAQIAAPTSLPGGVQIGLTPAEVRLSIGDSVSITATVTRDGHAEAGKAITFLSSNPAAARIMPATTMTDASGVASATIIGVASGDATLQVESQGVRKTAAIKVMLKLPALSLWLLTPLILLALLLYARRPRLRGRA